MSAHLLEEILQPQSIAVVGASGNSSGRGYGFTSALLEAGFKGKIYPVNPKYSEILGMKAYPSLRDIPGSVDYIISAVPAAEVLNILQACPSKGVKVIQLYTARFSETGRPEAIKLEQEILKQAKKLGVRLIGPNCMGVYYPKHGISFNFGFPKESGAVGAIFQSGNMTMELIRSAALRGLRFSKAISYGNALDFNECDYLEYLSQDSETKIILMYIEGVKDGRRFFHSLRRVATNKPVIIMKGGRGESGARVVSSHTASLAGSMKIWEALITQTGAISAGNLDEMIDLAVSFYFLPPFTGCRVGIAGGAGGPSVLAADQCEEAELDVIPLPMEIREELKSKGLPIWDWIGNPADWTIAGDVALSVGDMLRMMATNQNFDLLILIIGFILGGRQGNSAETYLEQFKLKECSSKPLLAVVPDRSFGDNNYASADSKLIAEVRTKLIEERIPFYPTVGRAAKAVRRLIDYYRSHSEGLLC